MTSDDGFSVKIETVTPTQAKALLDTSKNLRRLNNRHVNMLTRDIRSDRIPPSGQVEHGQGGARDERVGATGAVAAPSEPDQSERIADLGAKLAKAEAALEEWKRGQRKLWTDRVAEAEKERDAALAGLEEQCTLANMWCGRASKAEAAMAAHKCSENLDRALRELRDSEMAVKALARLLAEARQ